MGYAAVMVIAGVAMSAFGGLGGVANGQETASQAAVTEADRGGQLYLTSCASCHGAQGAGGPGSRHP